MRPIRLRFSGLHSYSTTQEVDFEQLMEGGLFGIFGPTGSGKSTVLDAITLALYARVDRAGGTRQGILNDNEDTLFVDFTFELGDGDATKRFQVERRYRRSGPHSVNVTHARLTQWHGDAQTVLADKDGEVTATIEQILGLKHQDFTRAVVLPQGKFAEFLAMQGSDRRHMLERLFALEDYGQRLMRRISERTEVVVQEITALTGEQTGLRDASKERVETLQSAVAKASERVAEARAQLDAVRKQHADASKMRVLQEELTAVQEQLGPLIAAETEIRQLKDELRLANAAEPIRRDLAAVDAADKQQGTAAQRLNEAKDRLEHARLIADEAEANYTHAHTTRQTEEPELRERKSRLKEALKDEERLVNVLQQKNELQEQAGRLQSESDQLQREEKTIQEQIAAGQVEKQKMQDEVRQLTVDPRKRQLIGRALHAVDRLEGAKRNSVRQRKRLAAARVAFDEASTEHEKAQRVAQNEQERVAELESALQNLETSPPSGANTITEDIRELEQLRGKVSQLESCEADLMAADDALKHARTQCTNLKQVLLEASQAVEDAQRLADAKRRAMQEAQEKLQQATLANHAATLASLLKNDQPCPVCGSIHHPSPATTMTQAANLNIDELEKAWRTAENAVTEAQRHKAIVTAQYESAETTQSEREDAVTAAIRRMSEIRASLPDDWQDRTVAEIRTQFMAKEEHLETLQKAVADWNTKIRALREQLNAQQKQSQIAADDLNAASVLVAGKTADVGHCQQALDEAEAELQEATLAFERVAKNLTLEQVRAEAKAIERADEKSATLRDALDQLDEKITTLQQKALEIQTKHRELETALQSINIDLRHLNREEDNLTDAIRRVTQGKPSGDLIREVTDRLAHLAQSESQANEKLEAARADLNRTEQAVAVAQESFNNAVDAAQSAHDQLEKQLRQAGFDSVEAASAALRPEEQRTQMEGRIEEHTRALERLRERAQQLETQIGDAAVDDATWAALEDKLVAAEVERETANTEYGAAKESLDDVIERHEQWNELEKKRVAAQQTKDRLDQLTALFRGNRFVEFVSEEYLSAVAIAASSLLGELTRHRYALEIDSTNGFVIRDDSNGGVKRPVSSLSGGETFVTSLALALALSNQIQLHGTYPLEFFFLDEGFGTLDPELLETVITSLEKLNSEQVNIGIISHVPELRQRMSRRLIVQPATATDSGSQLHFERG